MSSQSVAKKPEQQVAQPAQGGQMVEEKETSAKASAQAGLNLNIFGALSGVFSGKSNKKTEADGSSVEEREERAAVKGAGMGNMNAHAAGNAEQNARHMRSAAIEDQKS